MPRVRGVAVLGAIALFGVVGCAAEANPGSPGESVSPVARQTAISRENIEVQLQPARVKAGEKVWVLANCPIPEGGPEHRGTSSSLAFRAPVTLDPIMATPSPSASAGATPAARPWVRGQAVVAPGTDAGVYDVNARCEGTNDTGKASLRVVADGKPSDRPTDGPSEKPTGKPSSTPKATRTVISTHGPGTGGGGTAADGPHGDSGMPFGVTGVLLGVALAGGVGVAVARRRRS